MGLRDESWCSDCGCSQPYSEDEVVCGNCTSEAYEKRSLQLINYMKLHLISLMQDSEELDRKIQENTSTWEAEELDIMDISNNGKIFATRHLLSVASDILGIPTEEK